MTDTPEDVLALELINTIKSRMSPRAVLLENRIEKALAYLSEITNPTPPAINHVRRFLLGEYDDMPFNNPAATVRGLFERRFICRVVSTGYHNGAACNSNEPHGADWRCGYYWTAGALTEQQARDYGLITEAVEETTT